MSFVRVGNPSFCEHGERPEACCPCLVLRSASGCAVSAAEPGMVETKRVEHGSCEASILLADGRLVAATADTRDDALHRLVREVAKLVKP